MHPLLPALQKGLDGLGLALTPDQQTQLLAYMDLIAKWTKVYNLTAVRDADEMLTHHLLDSLAVVPPLQREWPGRARLLDVGSGAGLPGVTLAIALPVAFIVTGAVGLVIERVCPQHQGLDYLRAHRRPCPRIAAPFSCGRAFASNWPAWC